MFDDTALRLQKELLGLVHRDWGLVYMLSGIPLQFLRQQLPPLESNDSGLNGLVA